ncbi:non-lysosomal glucosylceramidase-like [Corticium candelabrum]|uniref:non-lysosomal glucosylceramidase-like n=1 Tax=Corticium candelabrum TaxID=121492 RepID=UPI002E262FAD|nr:non-lysosomal glucosylceramidase-like [Corticium candelabrum]
MRGLVVYVQSTCGTELANRDNLTVELRDISASWELVFYNVLQQVASRCGQRKKDIQVTLRYVDDEGDLVTVNSDREWREALKLAGREEVECVAINLVATTVLRKESGKRNVCSPLSCGSAISSCCPRTQPSGLGFEQTMPNETFLGQQIPSNVLNPNQADYKYTGEALRAVTLPLGPIGGGSIALAGDGGLRQWQVCNRVCHLAHVPDSFFAIRVDVGSTSKAAVLQSPTLYDDTGFKPENYITDHVVPAASKQLLSKLPGVKEIEITARYPIVEIDYTSGEVPVQIHTEAFNPCIPLDSKNSGIPVIVFNFTVTNTNSSTAKVSLLGSLQNFVGWDGATDIQNEVMYTGYGGNTNSLLNQNGMTAIDMSNASLYSMDAFNGHISLATFHGTADVVTNLLQFDNVTDLWKDFTTTGLPGSGQSGPSPSGKTWNGALALTREIPANTSQTFTFLLAWHFPHRYVNWSQAGFGIKDKMTQFYIGNQYANFWKDITEVLDYTQTNFAMLVAQTRMLRDAMYKSTLPWQVVDSAAARMMVFRSPTCMWHADGNLYGFEGCSAKNGCCPLNCTHVWNYEMALSRLYPDLERTMRGVDLQEQISPNSIIPSRTTVPLELRRQWSFWPNYTDISQASTAICVDGEIGTVNKTYREVLQGAPKDWFDKQWPQVKKVMQRWMSSLDDGTGVVRGPQPNTYDCAVYGVNTFIGTQYLCALRAAEEMAKLQGDMALAKTYHDRFTLGSAQLDKLCFTNGKWYTQVVDSAHAVNVMSDGTFVDALGGWWWARSLGLGDILPIEHVKSSLQYTFQQNHVKQFDPGLQFPRKFFDQRDAGMFIIRWPDGKVPKNGLLYSSEGAWTGLEYPFAEQCLYAGLNDIALQVLTEARQKYDGTRRSPWNEVECGDHYSRQMAGFLLFEIASGQSSSYASPMTINLNFSPRLQFTNYRGFFILGSCWGQYSQIGDAKLSTGTAQLTVMGGQVALAQLQLTSSAANATLTVGTTSVTSQVTQNAGLLTMKFSSPLALKASQTLTVKLG